MGDQSQIGPYVLESKIGAGGMGVVYRAVDTTLDRPVAIKVLLPEFVHDPELLRRFRLEAKAQANLTHPNIAVLYAFSEINEQCVIVMELLEGETFADILENRGRLPWKGALSLTQQTLQGLAFAHSRGVVHRDIKPSNLMLTRDGTVKIMDFGIAKAVGPSRMATRTGTLGTPTYMSPEQIKGEGIDARADIYSLGITLYQLLSGKVPFEGTTDFQVMNAHLNIPPPPLNELAADIPRVVIQCVEKALAKEKSGRFQNAEEFDQALAAAKLPPPPIRETVLEARTLPVVPQMPITQQIPAPLVSTPPGRAEEPQKFPAEPSRPAKKSDLTKYALVALAAVVVIGAALAYAFWPKSNNTDTSTQPSGSKPVRTDQPSSNPAGPGKPNSGTSGNQSKPMQATLLLNPDAACIVSLDGMEVKRLAAGEVAKISVGQGQHVVQAKDPVSGFQIEQTVTANGAGQLVVSLRLGEAERNAAAQQEAERQRQQQAAEAARRQQQAEQERRQQQEQAAEAARQAEQRRRQQAAEEAAAAEQRRRQQAEAARPKFANITVNYTGDWYSCSLYLNMNIGNRSFRPTGNSYAVSGVPIGAQNYGISGTIGCPTQGVCQVSGYGTLNIADGEMFNVVWANTSYGRCTVQLVPR